MKIIELGNLLLLLDGLAGSDKPLCLWRWHAAVGFALEAHKVIDSVLLSYLSQNLTRPRLSLRQQFWPAGCPKTVAAAPAWPPRSCWAARRLCTLPLSARWEIRCDEFYQLSQTVTLEGPVCSHSSSSGNKDSSSASPPLPLQRRTQTSGIVDNRDQWGESFTSA